MRQQFSIFDIATGRVLRTMQASGDNADANCVPGEAWVDGKLDPQSVFVVWRADRPRVRHCAPRAGAAGLALPPPGSVPLASRGRLIHCPRAVPAGVIFCRKRSAVDIIARPAPPPVGVAPYDLGALPVGTVVTVIDATGQKTEIAELSGKLRLVDPGQYRVAVDPPWPGIAGVYDVTVTDPPPARLGKGPRVGQAIERTRAALIARIDAAAAAAQAAADPRARLHSEKATEARAYLDAAKADPAPPLADFPFLAAEIPITGPDPAAVAHIILRKARAARRRAAEIEGARRRAKTAARAAGSVRDLQEIDGALSFP